MTPLGAPIEAHRETVLTRWPAPLEGPKQRLRSVTSSAEHRALMPIAARC